MRELIVRVSCFVVNLILGLPFSTGLPTWFRVIGFGVLIPAALAGAYWSKWASQPGRRP